ncbi:OLC1v1035855C1 [Oldenlandia corymbosa var. corymbosa]|uniref:OLC1v1035855C1 n=1 Tax=Oldenlandia corymbosa var. corymbosa TaxID=529605 RepID=A0AAV1CWG6_OLDCO|nr:OLC1v1035855C1 [Oldenlandia corymbosa var. corymbosa]
MPEIPISVACKTGYAWDTEFFGVAGGDLCIVIPNDANSRTFKFDIFALKRDYSEWVLKYRVVVAPLTDVYPEIRRSVCGFGLPWFAVTAMKAVIKISMEMKLISCDISNMVVDELLEVEGQVEGLSSVYSQVVMNL